MLCMHAGLFQNSVAWDALQNVPEHPQLTLPHRAAGAAEVSLQTKFEEYCHFFTNTDSFEPHIPQDMSGKHVLLQMQCRDDRIVSFSNGQALYEDLSKIALGTHAHVAAEAEGTPVLDENDEEVPKSEFVEVAGGHCSGFARCPMLLPAAVLRALARLEARHYDAK